MRYVWDPAKDVLNRRNPRMSLADGIAALEDPDGQSWLHLRFDYEEERIISIGRNQRAILVVVSTEQGRDKEDDEGESVRILSVRKATQREASWYYFGRT